MTVMSEPGLELCAFWKRFVGDERGIASLVGAMLMLLGLGLSVLTIDVGHLYLTKRRLQGAVDAAALAAAGDPANANTIVARVLTINGYSQAATVATGAYTADPSVTVANRFDTDPSAQQNAVRVTETVTTSGFLAGIFGDRLSQITATATAAQTPVTSFAAGTGLASLTGGQLNAVLGGLLGANLSLSLVNYQALVSTNVDALTFLDQLASQSQVSVGTYGDLANTNATMGQMAAAATAALNIHPDGNDSAALTALALLALQTPAATSAPVGSVVNTMVWQKRRIGSIVQQTPGQVTFNLFDLVAAMARVYGTGNLVNLGTALTVPIAGTAVSTRLALGAPIASVALAPVGTSISTAQGRLALTVTAANINLGIVTAAISLPLYLQIASGTATVAAIPCQTGGTMVTISTASQAATAQIGAVSDSDLDNFSKKPTIQPATVVTLSILGIPVSITANGSLAVASGPEADENFTQSDINSNTVKTASGSDAGVVFSGLANSLTLNATLLSSGGLLTGTIDSTVNSTVLPLLRPVLVNILSALDPATDTLLRTIGLRLGVIDVVVHGVRCGTPTLVS